MYTYPKAVLFLLTCSIANAVFSRDFAEIQADLLKEETKFRIIETQQGNFSPRLLESLDSLVKLSLMANRLGDAGNYIDRALQITRLEGGLHTPDQYRFLTAAIEVEMDQGNWKKTKEKLGHLKWLVGKKYEGSATDRVELLRWIVESHMRGFYEDNPSSGAEHLINSTQISEIAVIYSQANGLTELPAYMDLLLTLTNSYLLEVEGIRGGGSTSHRLRRLDPPELNLVEKRFDAEQKRYEVGLEKLQMIKGLSGKFSRSELEASAMSDLYIARWQDYFHKVDERNITLSRARAGLIREGFDTAEIDNLLNNLARLPFDNLALSFREVSTTVSVSGD